jgi:TusA-related sulfurtransferase
MNGDAQRSAALAIDGGELELGGGLLALVRPALDLLEPGGVLAVISSSRSAREDLPAWCRSERHDYLGCSSVGEREQHLIRRGDLAIPSGAREQPAHLARESRVITSADLLRAVPMPERADVTTGFAPRGARVEPGGPAYPFTLLERDRVAPPEVAQLYDEAVSAQWDAARDIPWHALRPLPQPLDRAIGQIMTFLAENELAALYVPARFVPRIHPAYIEVAMFLATQIQDEARHIDVFLKRARAGGGTIGISSAASMRSLHSLLVLDDFTEAAFLLSVLGEGTFLDLLRFIEEHAPDETTAEILRRARIDEARHVHFGLLHVRHALAHDAGLFARLESAVRRRAATLHGVTSLPAPVQDSLTILAARGTDPRAVARGHDRFRELLQTMHENRVKRMLHAGFTAEQAHALSELHTANLM